ncbi:hypothetical protein [Flavisolibacter ginsengisoli]|jgi:hypothetical protein|uniref:Lipoprotein n=1 Tax=Flavisolibacter ginsengisoli DSM 18119 TaxID=1121884 RepID=A0A1M5D433_9BACT|nr:hypothetical protein [Flavisolibacter ginsengisoli]SHF61799.1 hypothetical protein SAMN02745131_03103 [Flavisolibacter ginsengisoli DSM 18119]
MKNLLLPFLLITISCTCAFSQEVLKLQPCNDSLIHVQADSITKAVALEGFTLLKENSVTMESQYELPVIVPLQEKSLYHFVFIGDHNSSQVEVRLIDADGNMVIYEKRSRSESNFISFSYVPKVTLYHQFRILQVNKKKKKGLCGYVMLFKKTRV